MKTFRLQALFVATLLSAVVAGCGGSAKSEELKFDPAKAELTAHDALIKTLDLPGSGWSITDEDPKENDDELPETAACKDLASFQAEVKKLDDNSRAARAKRELGKPAVGSPLPTEVSVEIEIYRVSKALEPHLERARKLVESNSYSNCFAEVLGDVYKDAGLTATTRGVSASLGAPTNGFAFAAESQISGLPTPLRFENYGWIIGNAKVTVSLSGSRDAVTLELAKAAIEKTQSKLNEAADKQ